MELTIFKNNHFGQVRVIESENGELFFIASDVAKNLGYKRPSEAVRQHCKEKGTVKRSILTNGGFQDLLLINEPNVYRLIIKSQLPSAEEFDRWLFEEVVPTIRKTGGYLNTKEDDTPEMIMAKALQVAASTIENNKQKIKQLETQKQIQSEEIVKMQPFVDLAKDCYQSTSTTTASIIATRLGFKTSNEMNIHLKNLGVQYKIKGDNCWKLTSKYSCKGYTKTIPFPYPKQDGTMGARNQMEWTEAGFVFLRELLNKKYQHNE